MVKTNKTKLAMNITLKGVPFKQVNEFKCLGSIITANNNSAADIKRKLGLRLRNVNKDLNDNSKIAAFEMKCHKKYQREDTNKNQPMAQ